MEGSIVRMQSAGPRVPRAVMGDVSERIWTTIAADVDGVPQGEEIGKRKTTRRVMWAFKDEAEAWIDSYERDGWEIVHGPTPCAAVYFGDTDSPANCWSAEVEKLDTS